MSNGYELPIHLAELLKARCDCDIVSIVAVVALVAVVTLVAVVFV